MRNYQYFIAITFAVFVCVNTTTAQVASNPPYTLDQSVIAGGGGTSSDVGNTFSITGSIGQSVTDTSSAMNFNIKSGFFAAAPLAPTAASVSISGRILTPDGRGLTGAQISLTDYAGNARKIRSGAGGAYQFDDLEVGQTYILAVSSKHYEFQP